MKKDFEIKFKYDYEIGEPIAVMDGKSEPLSLKAVTNILFGKGPKATVQFVKAFHKYSQNVKKLVDLNVVDARVYQIWHAYDKRIDDDRYAYLINRETVAEREHSEILIKHGTFNDINSKLTKKEAKKLNEFKSEHGIDNDYVIDWEKGYHTINNEEVPAFVTDAVVSYINGREMLSETKQELKNKGKTQDDLIASVLSRFSSEKTNEIEQNL